MKMVFLELWRRKGTLLFVYMESKILSERKYLMPFSNANKLVLLSEWLQEIIKTLQLPLLENVELLMIKKEKSAMLYWKVQTSLRELEVLYARLVLKEFQLDANVNLTKLLKVSRTSKLSNQSINISECLLDLDQMTSIY
jgi:hypothetical protein